MTESQQKCANCLCSLEPKWSGQQSKFNVIHPNLHLDKNEHAPEVDVKKISVAAALFTIFNIPFSTPTISEDQIYICPSCHVDLINLFCSYAKFMHHQKQESLISQKIQEDEKSKSKPHQPQQNDKKLWIVWKSVKADGSSAYTLTPAGQNPPPQILVNSNQSIQNSNTLQQSNDKKKKNEEIIEEMDVGMEVEIKEQEVDEYEDPLQKMDANLNPSTTIQERKKYNVYFSQKEIKKLPTFVAEYDLPDPSEYSLYHLDKLQLPLKCPYEKCTLNSISSPDDDDPIFTSFPQYKNHVSSQHLHMEILKCLECDYGVKNFQLYFDHNIKVHDRRPIQPEEDLNVLLDKYLLPKSKEESLDEAVNIWCFAYPDLVKKYDTEFKDTGNEAAPFKCEKCFLDSPVTFERKELFYYHLNQNIHDSKVFKCDYKGCSCKFMGRNSESRFIYHCHRFHKLTLTTPDLSKYVTSSSQRLENIVTGGDEREIEMKAKETQEARFIRRIQKGIYELLGDPPFTCVLNEKDDCQNPTFLNASDLWKHFSTVHCSKNHYSCMKCSKVVNHRRSLEHHILFCSRKRRRKKLFLPPFICEKCVPSREFTTNKGLKNHVQVHHERPPKTFICETCGKSFSFQNNLQTHKKYHETSKPYICELCGKRYKTSTNLTAHRKNTHDEEGRLKYNAYCRMKNKRWKMNLVNKQNQNQDDENSTNSTFDLQTENEDENSNSK